MKLKQVLHLLNLLFLFLVFLCKCVNFQEKKYSLNPIETISVSRPVSALEKPIMHRYIEWEKKC